MARTTVVTFGELNSREKEMHIYKGAITGHTKFETGMIDVYGAWACLESDPGTSDGDPFLITVDIPTQATDDLGCVTVNVWEDNLDEATDAGVCSLLVIGAGRWEN